MNLAFLKEKGNKYIVFILLGLLVLVLAIPNTALDDTTEETTVQATESNLETQLARVLSSMEGVGEVEVMITLESTENSLFGTGSDNSKVCGVVVVAEGAGNAVVETRISEAIKALFSIDAHKISIVKRAMQEEDK